MTRFFLVVYLMTCVSLQANSFVFPPGEVPPVSLQLAVETLGKHSKKVTGVEFNPYSATLNGGSEEGSGAWQFSQFIKKGESIVFLLYFPENVCLVLDQKDNLLGAFDMKGKLLSEEEKARWERRPDTKDPFDEDAE